jgi:hypothetical protein
MTGTMRAFEIYLNGKRLCLAGIGDDGVLNTTVDSVVGRGRNRNQQTLRVGGLISPTAEYVIWKRRRLKIGDEVRVKIVETASIDRPKERIRIDPKADLKRQKQYVRDMSKKFGWKLTTGR